MSLGRDMPAQYLGNRKYRYTYVLVGLLTARSRRFGIGKEDNPSLTLINELLEVGCLSIMGLNLSTKAFKRNRLTNSRHCEVNYTCCRRLLCSSAIVKGA
jgi:hypothetical protein